MLDSKCRLSQYRESRRPDMSDPRLIDEIAAALSSLAASSPARDLERNARALLGGALARLDLVTREEFDIQRELLARAQERVVQLEARIADLEAGTGK